MPFEGQGVHVGREQPGKDGERAVFVRLDARSCGGLGDLGDDFGDLSVIGRDRFRELHGLNG